MTPDDRRGPRPLGDVLGALFASKGLAGGTRRSPAYFAAVGVRILAVRSEDEIELEPLRP